MPIKMYHSWFFQQLIPLFLITTTLKILSSMEVYFKLQIEEIIYVGIL